MDTSAVKVDAVPAPEVDAIPAVEVDAVPAPEVDAVPAPEVDAIPYTFNADTNQLIPTLDLILNKLTIADYRSIFFLLIDTKIKKEQFLFLVKEEKYILKDNFSHMYKAFSFRDALLIEIFGTLQKYNLLQLLGTCCHVFGKDKETFTQLSPLWKFLYCVCEQLADYEVDYLKKQLFPEDTNINVCCAEELICQAFLKGKLEENNWQRRLAEIFKCLLPGCSRLITSYKGSNLSYYPLRRPMKSAPCGIAVIMNHVSFEGNFPDRPESNSDANALEKLWQSFGFKTEIFTDLTFEEVNHVFAKMSRENHSNYDAFVVCYLSHGAEGIVVAKDGKEIKLLDLVDKIANECVTLVGKPKLFFVQACQGRGIQTGFGGPTLIPQVPRQQLTPMTRVPTLNNSISVALRTDVLLFNSSIEGFASFREGNGTWFINALVSNMERYGEELTLANVLTKVVKDVTEKEGVLKNTNISRCKQTPVEYNTLKHELKLKKVL
ncbi:unnamed protein product [Larinioides sclopetarius]|uniref:Caspase-8 n=1 Tax=Larinioides sclopetarius TaxID=280406 RepID=A0AAV1ZRV1_9ARAC